MKRLLAVAIKELRQFARDPFSLLMIVALPAGILVLYGFALNFDVRHVALAVQDRDHSASSRDLISSFVNSTYFDLVATPPAGEDLEALTERRVARAVLVIPEDFAQDLRAGRTSRVQLLLDGADAQSATTILGYAEALVAESNVRIAAAFLRRAGRAAPTTLSFEPRLWYNPELRSAVFLVPGLVGFLLMLTGVVSTALSVVREKERGTMEQLRVAPLRTWELIVGKTLPYLGFSLVTTHVILLTAWLLFGVGIKGPYLDLLLATLLYLLGALSFGLVISTIANTQTFAFQVSILSSLLPAMLLSGFIFPIRNMPPLLQLITYAVPARYYLVILRGIVLKGAGLGPYLDQIAALSIYALLMLVVASARLARKEA